MSRFQHFFKVILPRVLSIVGVLAVTYWMLLSPESPFREKTERQVSEAPEKTLEAALPETSEHLWSSDGQWSLGNTPWNIGQQSFASKSQAEQAWADISNLPPASERPLPPESVASDDELLSFGLGMIVGLFDEDTTTLQRSDEVVTRTAIGDIASLRLFTTSDDRFILFRVLTPDGEGWKVISISEPVQRDGAAGDQMLEIPEGVNVVGTRRSADGLLSAQFLETSIPWNQLLATWKKAGWKVRTDRTKSNHYFAQRGGHVYSVAVSDDFKSITIIRLEG